MGVEELVVFDAEVDQGEKALGLTLVRFDAGLLLKAQEVLDEVERLLLQVKGVVAEFANVGVELLGKVVFRVEQGVGGCSLGQAGHLGLVNL